MQLALQLDYERQERIAGQPIVSNYLHERLPYTVQVLGGKFAGDSNVPAGDYVCCFCGKWFPRDQLFWGDDDVTICRKCAAKAQIALLHPDDPEVIHECQQIESEQIAP